MIWLVLLLLVAGVFLSAFFSGSETGFYRVTRVRLLIDGLDGDLISRMLLHLTNHPALFVATTLIGNNLANYVTSLGIVLSVQMLFASSELAETIAPMVMSPLVFVYCELLPKQFFFRSPNRMLRRCGPLLLFFTVLFAPVAAVLWVLGWLLETMIGQPPLRVRLTLARKELQRVLEEGQEVGILHPAQRGLAQKLFSTAAQTVFSMATPINRVMSIPLGITKKDALRLAAGRQTSIVPVRKPQGKELVGYVRVIDLHLLQDETVSSVRPLPRIRRNEPHLTALMRLQSEKADVAVVEDDDGQAVGLLYTEQLTDPLFNGA
jgi:putative hemolysin